MGFQIEDGHGSGKSVGVNQDGALKVSAVTSSVEHHVNHHHKQAYTCTFEASPTATGDCIFYAKNTNDTDMTVEGFWLSTDTASTTIRVEIANDVTDITAGATETLLYPANLNAGSGLVAEGEFYSGTDLESGTGLTANTNRTVGIGYLPTATGTSWFNFQQDVIIPKNKTITLWVDEATAAVIVTGQMEFNYHNDTLG